MGDALSTGIGLWGGANVEFRGAAFTVGGDASIDGLVTFPSNNNNNNIALNDGTFRYFVWIQSKTGRHISNK